MTAEKSNSAARFVSSAHKAYGLELHRYLVRRLRNAEDAADLAQEVYLRLLRLEKSALVRKPIAYMYVIASQVAHQFRMQMESDPVTYDSDAVQRLSEHPEDAQSEGLAERLSAEAQIKQLLNDLPETHRNVLLLRKREGLSWTEIADRLGISVHTVKKYLYEARAKIALMKPDR